MKFIVVMMATALVSGLVESDETWELNSDKMVDIGIVIDQNPLTDLDAHPEQLRWYQGLVGQSRTAFAKLVQDVITSLVETRKSEINASIAITFKNWFTKLNQSFEQTKGKRPSEIAEALNRFDLRPSPNRSINRIFEEGRVRWAREDITNAAGNRPGVPDFLLWIGLHLSEDSTPFAPLNRMHQYPNGPDLVVTVEATDRQVFDVRTVWSNRLSMQNVAVKWDDSVPSQIVTYILDVLSACSQELHETPCYFRKYAESCTFDQKYRPQSQNDPAKKKYCINTTFEQPCQHDKCLANCDKAPREATESGCSVTCGQGWQETVPKGYQTDKFVKHCPIKEEKCDTGVQCPSTSTPANSTQDSGQVGGITQAPGPLKGWHIVLIVVGIIIVIAFIVCIFVLIACLRKKTKTQLRRRPVGNRGGHRQQSRVVRRSENRSKIPDVPKKNSRDYPTKSTSPGSNHRHKDSKPSRPSHPPQYVELGRKSPKDKNRHQDVDIMKPVNVNIDPQKSVIEPRKPVNVDIDIEKPIKFDIDIEKPIKADIDIEQPIKFEIEPRKSVIEARKSVKVDVKKNKSGTYVDCTNPSKMQGGYIDIGDLQLKKGGEVQHERSKPTAYRET